MTCCSMSFCKPMKKSQLYFQKNQLQLIFNQVIFSFAIIFNDVDY